MTWTPDTLRHYDAQKRIIGSAASDAARDIRRQERPDAPAPEHKRGTFPPTTKLAGRRASSVGSLGGAL